MFRFRGEILDIRGADELALQKWARELEITPEHFRQELTALCRRLWIENRIREGS